MMLFGLAVVLVICRMTVFNDYLYSETFAYKLRDVSDGYGLALVLFVASIGAAMLGKTGIEK
jgi:hypothetical protein